MVTLPVINNNLFMSCLLKQEIFDRFHVREVTLHTSYKTHIDGKRNVDFYDGDELDGMGEYLAWSELRPHMFELIKGSKSPSYFKIILSTSPEQTQQISDAASAFFLNITFKDRTISCITGTAYASFSLDKTPEQTWDKKMTEFLISHSLI